MGMEIHPQEAEIVRLVFELYLEGDGKTGPLGDKSTVEYLNGKGYRLRQGGKFNAKFIDEMLRRSAYVGRHMFNRMDSTSRRPKPEGEHIAVACPRVISDSAFARIQELLTERNPRKTPPRVVNTPILLTGVARCGDCGAAMVKGTGKSGRYSYYMCSTRNRVGTTSCKGQRVPMAAADAIMSSALLESILVADRLSVLSSELCRQNQDRQG